MTNLSVIFDFDGTIALGHGPLDAYARAVGELTSTAVAEACRVAVADFDSGESDYLDGYAAVHDAARVHDVDDTVLSTAYLRSRKQLATDAAPIYPPTGLREFMDRLSRLADCVLATNAPPLGLDRALAALGVADLLTHVYASVGKPAGLDPIVSHHLAHGPTLAIGDIWDNDLAPAHRLGAATGFVGVGRVGGPVTMRGATLADIYDDILGWAHAHRDSAEDGIHLSR